MLLFVIKIMVIVVLASKLVDFVEDKGHASLWVKIGTPVMWIVGEFVGRVAAVVVTGVTPEAITDPMFQNTPEGSNFLFISEVLGVGGALCALGALYVYARSLRSITPTEETSFR